MRTYGCISAALLAVFFAGCNRIAEPVPETDSELVFHARWAESPDTRTALQSDGTSIWWTLSEKINVFYGNKFSGVFVSTNEAPSALASFQGTLTVVTGTIENGNASQAYWAVYPYSTDNSCDGESVTLTVPAEQKAVEGSFADKFFPAVAKSHSVDLAFYNVCGGVRFSVFNEGIESVTFKANGGEPLVGKVQVGFGPDDLPVVKGIADGKDEVTVSAPAGGFVPGRSYFAAFLPQTLSQGLSMTFKKANGSATYVKENALTVNRSRFGTLDEKDKDLTFSGGTTPDPSGIIVFADGNLKKLLVAAFDTDGDQELSYAEAAAVTSFGNVLDDYCEAVSFDEFQYFTGITRIPENQFAFWEKMTSIVLPESIESIGSYAFRECTGLTSLAIPQGVTEMSYHSLSGCTNLVRLSIGSWFSNKTLKDVGLSPETSRLSEVILLPGVDKIKESAFSGWTSLESVILPDGVKTIGKDAFKQCSQLKSVNLPDTIVDIELAAFQYCSSLSEITLPSQISSIAAQTFLACKGLKSIVIPDKVTLIAASAFYDCESLASVIIPDGVNYIGTNAFKGTALTEVVLPQSLTELKDGTFLDCTALRSIVVPEKVQSIGQSVFSGCSSLQSVVLPDGLKTLGERAFENCAALKRIDLPAGLSKIGDHTFSACSNLASISFPANLSQIDSYAFANCTSLGSADLPSSVKNLGPGLFYNCSNLTSVTLPEGISNIQMHFFYGCSRLQSVILPASLNSLGAYAFAESGIVSIDIPKGISIIWEGTFDHCHSLQSVSMKVGITSIGSIAFQECTALTTVTIPKSVTSISDKSFADCPALASVILNPAEPPALSSDSPTFSGSNLCKFYVPEEAVNAYKTHASWTAYADRIFPVTALE